jgi:hypothetical protein
MWVTVKAMEEHEEEDTIILECCQQMRSEKVPVHGSVICQKTSMNVVRH